MTIRTVFSPLPLSRSANYSESTLVLSPGDGPAVTHVGEYVVVFSKLEGRSGGGRAWCFNRRESRHLTTLSGYVDQIPNVRLHIMLTLARLRCLVSAHCSVFGNPCCTLPHTFLE